MLKQFLLQILLSTCIIQGVQEQENITIYLIGDSTMSIKVTGAYPETGWGMPFKYFFDSTVTVDNRAKNGRSTRSFIAENRWQPVVDALKPGDYVMIQFGHNDAAKNRPDRYTDPVAYKELLEKYVKETLSKGAHPVLLTPVSRRRFDSTGMAIETHAAYTPVVKEVATAMKVPCIDLDAKSRELYQSMGEENSKLLFLQLKAGEHPNYPKGKVDNTHFNELGARLIAQIVLHEMEQLHLPVCEHIVKSNR